jgi:hypothetical protein
VWGLDMRLLGGKRIKAINQSLRPKPVDTAMIALKSGWGSFADNPVAALGKRMPTHAITLYEWAPQSLSSDLYVNHLTAEVTASAINRF